MCMSDGALLEPYRGYLLVLAELHLDRKLRGRIDAADVVQETLLQAYQALPSLRDRQPAVLTAWLRQILTRQIIAARRLHGRDRRDVDQEPSLAAELDQSAAGLQACLAASQTSPSQAAIKQENLLRLADALLQLPTDQRQAVILKHLQHRTLDQIGADLDRTPAAVAGLLRRGLAKLREILESQV